MHVFFHRIPKNMHMTCTHDAVPFPRGVFTSMHVSCIYPLSRLCMFYACFLIRKHVSLINHACFMHIFSFENKFCSCIFSFPVFRSLQWNPPHRHHWALALSLTVRTINRNPFLTNTNLPKSGHRRQQSNISKHTFKHFTIFTLISASTKIRMRTSCLLRWCLMTTLLVVTWTDFRKKQLFFIPRKPSPTNLSLATHPHLPNTTWTNFERSESPEH